MLDSATPVRYGRVTRATISRLWSECFIRERTPPLGELLVVEDSPVSIVAVAAAASTEGIDPSRRVTAHGGPDHDRERVLAENPHVPALLITTFEAVIVGHESGGRLLQFLPPQPAPILARVRACAADECVEFTESLDFLELLLAAGPLGDDLTAAALRGAAAARPDGRAFLVRAGKALTPLLATDPPRLHAILRRLQP